MKIQDVIDRANRFVVTEQYIEYTQQFKVPTERAIKQSGYDGISEVTWENVKAVIVFMNTLWMYLPDNKSIRFGAFFEICNFCEIALSDCDDYEDYFSPMVE